MREEFLSARRRLAESTPVAAEPFDWAGAKSGECWANVNRVVAAFGGSIAYGWALSGVGPRSLSRCGLPALYQRWVNHALWLDNAGRYWEVTPARDVLHPPLESWQSTLFVPDPQASFELVAGQGWARPSCYIPLRREGEEAAYCLFSAERAAPEHREEWLDRALASIEQGGFIPRKWTIETVGDRIKNLWLVAE